MILKHIKYMILAIPYVLARIARYKFKNQMLDWNLLAAYFFLECGIATPFLIKYFAGEFV